MNAATRLGLLALLAVPLVRGETATAPAPVRIALFDLRVDAGLDASPGNVPSGPRLTALLARDLSVLSPLAVVAGGGVGPKTDPSQFDVAGAVSPGQAAKVGGELGATTLFGGRILKADGHLVIAAKVVSVQSGETIGAMVRIDASGADALSQLSVQVARIAFSQCGLKAPEWPPAAIVGTRTQEGLLEHDRLACVLSVDGRLTPDETEHWKDPRSLQPGLHEVFARYYDGSHTADHSFVVNAVPGARYQVRFEPGKDNTVRLWIDDAQSGNPATPSWEGKMTDSWDRPGVFPDRYIPPNFPPTYFPPGYSAPMPKAH